MQKTIVINRRIIGQGVALALVIVGLAGYFFYQVGYHQATREGEKKLLAQANQQGDQWSKDQLALDRMAANYNAACYNYQVLYNAYDQLYKKAGAAQTYISRPDGAKGNEDSCYR